MMIDLKSILTQLETLADPSSLPGMAHFGITTENRLGIAVPKLRALARKIGRDHPLALELWQTGIPEARILASMTADPAQMTQEDMDAWVHDFDSWDICDACCNNLFIKTPYAWDKVPLWVQDEAEFVRRAGFVMIACLAMHDKQSEDSTFIGTFPLIKAHADDPRNFVRKAVNWALRGIGKRNLTLNAAAVAFAGELQKRDNKTARWIATDALRELKSEKVQERLKNKAKKSSGNART